MSTHVESLVATTLVTTAETQVLSGVSPFNATELPGDTNSPIPCLITVVLDNTPGAGTTALTIRVRHGVNNPAGALVGVAVTAPPNGGSLEFTDTTGDISGYTITAQQVGATGNGSITLASADFNNL